MQVRHKVILVAIAGLGALCAIGFLASAPRASAQPRADSPDEHALQQAYIDHIAANNAAAEKYRASHPDGAVVEPSSDEKLIASNYGCPEGTRFWQRDRVTDLCATMCTSDKDCGPDDGRCRIVDARDPSKEPEMPLVDDLPPEEIPAWMDGTEPESPPMMVCDPFFDIKGAVDADLAMAASAK